MNGIECPACNRGLLGGQCVNPDCKTNKKPDNSIATS